MNIDRFIMTRPFVYHLTNRKNLDSIVETRHFYSTQTISEMVKMTNRIDFLKTRRRGCVEIGDGNRIYHIRDQDPLSETVLIKCLEDGWTFSDFVYHLNSKVFFWPTEKDLLKHFARYQKTNEKLIIFKIETEALFALNKQAPKFCRLNSGAPRASSGHKGKGAPRGSRTFLTAKDYPGLPSTVREVTFEEMCILPPSMLVANQPHGPFKKV